MSTVPLIPTNIPLRDEVIQPAAIQPIKFDVEYKEVGGQYTAEEWVEWAKKNTTYPNTTKDKIKRCQKDKSLWMAIEPFYKAWKAGADTELVVNGTPLAAWPGVTRQLCELMRPFRILSVEDLASMPDSLMQKIPHPAMYQKREQAKKFLATKDIAIAVNSLTEQEAKNKHLEEELEKVKRMLADANLAAELKDPPKPRGRKPKVEEAAV